MLDSLAGILLDARSTRDALDAAAAQLYDFFASIAGVPNGSATVLPAGRALAPADAASCTRDGLRTALFLRALRDAIRARPRRAEVVYAGTGPFAPLAMPFIGDADFTLIDIHAESVAGVERILRALGVTATTVVADASTYKHHKPIDIVVAEVMQRALTVEPQVGIVRNLVPQLAPDGILIPERVVVELRAGEERIGTAMALSKDDLCEPRTLLVHSKAPATYETTIHVDDRHVLRPLDSGLTHPQLVDDLEPGRVEFRYERNAIRWRPAPGAPTPAR
jgi:hypothetical protein